MESTHPSGTPSAGPPIDELRLDEVRRRLTDPDRDVRYAAALDLGTTPSPTAAPTLVARLGDEQDFFVRDTLCWALTRVPDTATPLLLEALAGTETQPRVQALHVLSKIADPATTDTILALTADADAGVAAKARWALTRIADPVAIPALTAHLGTGDSTTRNELVRDLASFGTAAVPDLTTALADDQATVRSHAAEVLCFIGPEAESATDALTRALEDATAEVRLCAAMALHEIGTSAAHDALSRYTEAEDPRIRAIACRSQP